MRFEQYKMITELCTTVSQASDYMLETKDLSILKTYFDAVNTIFKIVTNNLNSLKKLDVLEAINSILLRLADQNNYDLNELSRLSHELYELCKSDIIYKLRVLFVAELGGKWDSMASVYEAFKKRSDCDVDVVLQPIFRAVKLSDGTERHDIIYNDYLTDLGIAFYAYDKYDIESIKPDITFISQPYESVTLPMFWPENISKYSKLVYLPYFTATTIEKSFSSAYNSFFFLNTQKYSWKIPCQNELMKRYYEKIASRHGENVIVTGLPKWDYPMKLNRENTPCPKKWQSKLEGKTVFLWNSHFSSSIQGINIIKEGMELLNIFIENPDIALIWRPHPMTETVIKVYTPENLPKYYEILDVINKSSNMIIDDFSTYDNSFVWSDALISDVSSIMDQYLFMNKPYALSTNIKQDEEIPGFFFTKDGLYDYSKVYYVNSIEDIKEFIKNVSNRCDVNKDGREYLLETLFEYADGCVGERLTERLIKAFFEEAGIREYKTFQS